MAEHRARFRFITDRSISIVDKRLAGRMLQASSRDQVALINRAWERGREAARVLAVIELRQSRLLADDVLEDAAADREDLDLIETAMSHLRLAIAAIERIRERRVEADLVLEEALDPIYAPPEEKRSWRRPAAKPTSPPAPVSPGIAPPVPEAGSGTFAVAPAVAVKLDPELLARAQRELRNRVRKEV